MSSRLLTPIVKRLLAAAGPILCTGCGERGTLHLVPLNQTRIEKDEPLITRVGPADGWYAIEGKRITMALERKNFSLIGEYGKQSQALSIVVEGLPAHKSRDYLVNKNGVRGRLRRGAQHVRFASISGILALWMEPDGRIRGRLRCLVKVQQFNVMMGWTGDQRALLVGEFSGTRDRERVEAVRRRSEEGGLERAENEDSRSDSTSDSRSDSRADCRSDRN
jgi:hypothetical protein